MKTNTLHQFKASLLLLGMVLAVAASAIPQSAFAAVLPASTCTEAGGVRTCDLYATTGTLSLPGGGSVTIWGYAADGISPASLPGPMLIANSGETLEINLHNNLGEVTSLSVPGLNGASDLVGVADGGSKTYTFAGLQAGTYLYQAGPTANGERQVAMGMYGVLIVRPAGFPLQAYGAASSFDDEAVLVMSEVDPALNAAPASFDMREYDPKYFLYNGKAYPNTDEIDTIAGHKVLLRVVNAGIHSHPVGVLGVHYTVLSMDGNELAYPYSAVSETLGAGQTADMLVSIPLTAVADQKYAVYNPSLRLLNNNQRFGGMLTFLHVVGSIVPGDTVGPTASGLSLSPNPSNGSSLVTFNATLTDTTNIVDQAEYFLDTTGANGTGVAMTASDSAFDSLTEAVTAAIAPGSISSGSHTIYIHGKDLAGNWGPFTSIALVLDKVGPSTTGLSANPNPSLGTGSVALSGTGNDSANGNNNVVDAEFFIDVVGADGTGTTMTRNQTAPVVSLTGTISTATMSGLSEGYHWVYAHSKDSFGNWGAFGSLQLGVDKTGPATSSVQLRPNPNNGAQPYSPSIQSVRVDAKFTEPGSGPVTSTVKNAEFFIDAVGANGTGILMTPSDGLFNSSSENAYAYIPLSTVNAMSQGNHVVSIHGKDAAGNWGPFVTMNLVIDKTKPAVSGLAATPNPTNTTTTSNTSFALTGLASDPVAGVNSNIVRAEWYEGTDPGAGFGTAMQAVDGAFDSPSESITATFNFVALNWTRGSHTLYVRTKDAAGNWSPTVSIVVNVVYPNNIFSDGFESGNFSAWSTTGGNAARISVTSGSAQAGTYKMNAVILSGTSGYVQDNTPFTDTTYRARFYFNPNSYTTGSGGNPAAVTIFSGLDAANNSIFQVQYRRSSSTGYQVRLVVTRAGGTTATNWYAITNGAWNAIEISWASGGSTSALLYTGGTLRQTLTGLNTSAYILDTVRLGPQGTLPNNATTYTVYFDNFVSTRNTLIGP